MGSFYWIVKNIRTSILENLCEFIFGNYFYFIFILYFLYYFIFILHIRPFNFPSFVTPFTIWLFVWKKWRVIICDKSFVTCWPNTYSNYRLMGIRTHVGAMQHTCKNYLMPQKVKYFLRLFIAHSSHPTDFSPQFRLRPLNHDRIVTKGRNVITGAIRGNKLIEDAAS